MLQFGLRSRAEVIAQDAFQIVVEAQRPGAVVEGEAGAHPNEHSLFVPRLDCQRAAADLKGGPGLPGL